MYKKHKRYKYNQNYYYHRNSSSLIEDFFELILKLIIQLLILLGHLFKKLFLKLFYFIKQVTQEKSETFNIEINKSPLNIETETFSQPKPPTQDNNEQKYSLKQSILSPAEKEFLSVLEQIIDNRYHIECQVQLSRIVRVNDSNEHFTNYHDFNKIKAKSIDFILFNKEQEPQLAIELDDHTHSRIDRIKRDLFVNDVMKQINLPILHVRVAYPYPYNIEQLRQQIYQLLNKKPR